MRELERKYRLNSGLDSVDAALRKVVLLGAPVEQRDEVYARSLRDLSDPKTGTTVARLRYSEGAATLTVKRRRDKDLDRDEFETVVSDGPEAEAMLRALGLRHLVTVTKRRRLGRSTEHDLTVSLDDVDRLGSFLELEVLADDQTATGALEQRLGALERELASSLDFTPEPLGYDRLLLQTKRRGF